MREKSHISLTDPLCTYYYTMDPFVPGRLSALRIARKPVTVVPMGGVNYVSFQQMPRIATEQLNGCSAVIIASAYGAILGHIPPLPLQPETDPLGHQYVRSMMAQVAALYHNHIHEFPTPDTVIVCAWMEGTRTFGLPDHLQIMQQCFQSLGHNPTIRPYSIPSNRRRSGGGTVIVQSNPGQTKPTVYVEDKAI